MGSTFTPPFIDHYKNDQVLTMDIVLWLTVIVVTPNLIEHRQNVNQVLTLDQTVWEEGSSGLPTLIENCRRIRRV
jgi:hypothetical protein